MVRAGLIELEAQLQFSMLRSPRSPGNQDEDLKRKLEWKAIKRVLELAKPYRSSLIIAGVLMLFSTAISLAMPLLVQKAFNDLQQHGSVEQLDRQSLAIVLLVILGAGVGYLQFVVSAVAGNKIVTGLRVQLFAHLLHLPVAYFDRTRSGDLTSHLSNDVSQLQSTLTDDLVRLAGQIITLAGGMTLAVVINWKLTIVVVGLLIVAMSFFVVTGRAVRKINRGALDALADSMGTMSEALANIRLVKAFARENHEETRAENRLQEVFRLSVKGSRLEAMMGSVGLGGFMLMMVCSVWYGGRGVMTGVFKLGDVAGFLAAIFIISGPMAQMAALYTKLQRAIGAADRLFAILDEPAEAADPADAIDFPISASGRVTYRDVIFQYVADTPVLQGLSLELPAGKVTAVVGPSGAGKTTLSALLYRFYEPESGAIEIDGVPVSRIRRESLRTHVGIVPQDPILFNGTIRENIRYGRLTATDEEVLQASRAANVDEFVKTFPAGYETMIGERGITLSGGQRQRVAIARAMLKDPRILVLDEATSALDTLSEALVREALDRLMVDRTTLVIAHRLSTIQHADQIVVLDDGQIVELGTHQELLGKRGRYAELYELVGA